MGVKTLQIFIRERVMVKYGDFRFVEFLPRERHTYLKNPVIEYCIDYFIISYCSRCQIQIPEISLSKLYRACIVRVFYKNTEIGAAGAIFRPRQRKIPTNFIVSCTVA